MIRLSCRGEASRVHGEELLGRVTRTPRDRGSRLDYVLVSSGRPSDAAGYVAVLCAQPLTATDAATLQAPVVHGVSNDHLEDGDVVTIQRDGHVRTLYRRRSRHNTLFATDRCNSFCLMCSQPPRDVDDSGILAQHLKLLSLIDPATPELGITGGEPTLLGDDLIALIAACRDQLPATSLHMLTNGRAFADAGYVSKLAAVQHPDLMIGIPLYSDLDAAHDHVVQARGAFDETMRGLHNLGRAGQAIELRVVLHRLTVARLPDLADFIYRNLTFVSHVALMGLEITGFTIPNLDSLWIDPFDYQHELRAATLFLAARGVRVSIYNHQLCTVPPVLWPFCSKSISDWKNEYLPACDACQVREQCGGLFSSGLARRHSGRIAPVLAVV